MHELCENWNISATNCPDRPYTMVQTHCTCQHSVCKSCENSTSKKQLNMPSSTQCVYQAPLLIKASFKTWNHYWHRTNGRSSQPLHSLHFIIWPFFSRSWAFILWAIISLLWLLWSSCCFAQQPWCWYFCVSKGHTMGTGAYIRRSSFCRLLYGHL